MPNEMEMDPRERTAEEIEDMFHNAGRVARSAVMTEADQQMDEDE